MSQSIQFIVDVEVDDDDVDTDDLELSSIEIQNGDGNEPEISWSARKV